MTKGADPVHVLVYEPYPWSMVSGNLQTLRGMLKYAPRSEIRFTVMVPFDGGFLEHAKALDVDTVVLPPPARVNRYGGEALRSGFLARAATAVDMLRYSLRVGDWMRREGVDVVYANCVRTALTVGVGARRAGVPMLLYVKGELDNPVLDRIALNLSDRILFFCAENRDDHYPQLVRRLSSRIDVLPPGLDPDHVETALAGAGAAAREFGLDRGPNVAYLGQLFPPKGVHHLVDAFGAVAETFPSARLFLIGDPMIDEYADYPERLRDRIRELGVEDRVVFTGWREDALSLLAGMDVLVHPTLAEGFGRAVLEGMALGLPVIASRVGGLRASVRDGETGYLVPPGDPVAIADRLGTLLADPDLGRRMGERGRARVASDFMVEDKIEALAGIWRGMGGRSP